jgi:hypothetical protein
MFTRPVVVLLVIVAWVMAVGVPGTVVAQVPVSLELVTSPGFAIEEQQDWFQALNRLGFTDLRLRTARPGDEPAVVNRGTPDQPRYVVTGILTRDNRLQLPGLTVRFGQRQQLGDWLERLRAGGEDAITGEPGAFGLTAKQFEALHEAVRPAFEFETKGQPSRDVIRQIRESIPVRVEVDPSAAAAVEGSDAVLDELQGLSRGTALAAALRPLGMIVTVTGQGQASAGLRITRPAGKEEAWPIGTAPASSPHKTAPALFRDLNVEIHDRPLAEALDALQQRVKLPFVFDHNALAKHDVDLQQPVSFPAKRTFYKKAVDDLLYQAKLRSELRIDDAQHAFVWITTIKK